MVRATERRNRNNLLTNYWVAVLLIYRQQNLSPVHILVRWTEKENTRTMQSDILRDNPQIAAHRLPNECVYDGGDETARRQTE